MQLSKSFVLASLLHIWTAQASVACLKVGATATAKWTDSAGQTCTWTGTVGSNFGMTSSGGE